METHASSTTVELLGAISGFIWGPYLLIPLLLLTGIYLTILLRGLQFWSLPRALYLAFMVRKDPDSEGDISHFQALMTALAATVGTGNIVGVATAIAAGGPGALFWMWITGLFGMATKYCEAFLSVTFRVKTPRGEYAGGPMYFLRYGIKNRYIAILGGGSFALFAAIASFGIGNMVQSHSVAEAMHEAFGVEKLLTGIIISIAVGAVTIGGVRSIARVTGVFVPCMIVAYLACALFIIVTHAQEIPRAFYLVFAGAFGGTEPVAGGFLGASIAAAMRYGIARGIFSNESGLGSGGIAAAAAQTAHPVRQSLVSMTQTFIDTLIICTITGIAIIVTGAWEADLNGARLTQEAFRLGLPGSWGTYVVAVSLAMFAFSTLLGWCYYGERCVEYLLGSRAIPYYRLLFIVAAFLGTVYSLQLVWSLSDVMNGLMALPNLIGLLLLSKITYRESKKYFQEVRP